MTAVHGEVDRIAFRNEENGWTVLRLRSDKAGPVTVTGNFTNIHEGEYVELQGIWTNHKSYGRQFKVNRRLPYTTADGVQRYLASPFVRGIGEKTAAKIVDHFGVDALKILDETPHRLEEIPSIGKKKSNAIISAWQENKNHRDAELFLVSHGLSTGLAIKVMQRYQEQTINKVTENPYRLAAEIPRVGFITADKIAQKMGIPADSLERITAAIVFQLQQAEDQGHLFLTTSQLVDVLGQSLQVSANVLIEKLPLCLKNLNMSGVIVSQSTIDASGEQVTAHYQTDLLMAEMNVARKVKLLLQHQVEDNEERLEIWLDRYQENGALPLSEDQRAAVKLALQSRVYILTGGPGVGKTTTANAIIRLFKAMNYTVALCAPTGRAAQRLTEISQLPAMTIHRMLEWAPNAGGFQKNGQNPLPAQVVIVDESSMLDIRLADALLEALGDKARVIFIGDVDQLPSVGPGNFLRDLIDSNVVPYSKLTEIFRQATTSRIIQAAHSMNRGRMPEFVNEAGSDCRFIEVESPAGIRHALKELACEILPRKCGYDAIKDIQILSPMNRGDLGTQLLNEELQKVLNPKHGFEQDYQRQGLTLRPRDKVIQCANNYELNVFNGDIGFVSHCLVDGGKVVVRYGDRDVTYDAETIHDVRLAYAITIHKSQGSEFPVVLIPVSMQHYIMLQRNLIYTALTRAKKLAIFVGTKPALEHAIAQVESLRRQTRLVEFLKMSEAPREDYP